MSRCLPSHIVSMLLPQSVHHKYGGRDSLAPSMVAQIMEGEANVNDVTICTHYHGNWEDGVGRCVSGCHGIVGEVDCALGSLRGCYILHSQYTVGWNYGRYHGGSRDVTQCARGGWLINMPSW